MEGLSRGPYYFLLGIIVGGIVGRLTGIGMMLSIGPITALIGGIIRGLFGGGIIGVFECFMWDRESARYSREIFRVVISMLNIGIFIGFLAGYIVGLKHVDPEEGVYTLVGMIVGFGISFVVTIAVFEASIVNLLSN